ncbi:hypothetical protein LCGC14_2535300 [marine sediment metagenome]|uniref:Uncharacterized protein n=1 Tax=marine sediment metagenome TaxID=412755 RepID=A0A0F9ASB0_9ZZZZ
MLASWPHRALHALELVLLVAITVDIAYMILRKRKTNNYNDDYQSRLRDHPRSS